MRAPLIGIVGLAEPLAVAFARGVVLEQLADLGEREPGVVAEAADEQQALEVGCVVEPVVAVGSGRRLEQADLLVVADARVVRPVSAATSLIRRRRVRCSGWSLPPMIPQP